VKISCPTCSAKYSIADEKVQNRLAKIRCRKCSTSIVIDGNVSPASVYAADAGGSPEAESAPAAPAAASIAMVPPGQVYTVDLGESDQRQMSLAQLVEAYNNASVTPDTYVWADGFADWTPLGQVEEIVAALHAAAAAATTTAGAPPEAASALGASTQIDEKPWDSGPSVPKAPAGLGVGAPVATGADLFGSVSDAGNESDGVAIGNASNPFSGANTGARNESSVLFSLSALTSGTGSSRPSVPAPAMSSAVSSNNDDSGLIDLKALTATAQAMPAAARPAPVVAAAVSPFAGASPLGGPSPLSAPNYGASIGSMPPPKNNTGLYIGASIVIAAIAVAAIVTFGGSDEQPVAPPAPAVAAPLAAPAPAQEPAAAPAPAPAPTPSSDAKPPATGTESDSAAPPTPKKKAVSKPASSSSPAPSASPSPAAAPAPKPKSSGGGKCGCKSDDLMCLMNCAK